jgi:glycine/D-amino acid oxidase-like deaminating enzyme
MPDVIVIGGGVIGTAAALELARAGAEVTLYERGQLAAGASGASNGLVTPPIERPLMPLWQASADAYRALAAESDVPFLLDAADIGTLIVATTDEQLAELRAVPPEGPKLLDTDALREAEPALSERALGALLIEQGWRVDALSLTAALAAAATAAGARVVTGTPVRSLSPGGAVHTDGGTHRANRVLLAAGAWTRRLAGWIGRDVPVRPVRGWLMVTAAGPPLLRRMVIEAGWAAAEGPQPGEPVTLADLADGRVPPTGPRPGHRLIAHEAGAGGVLVGGSEGPSIRESGESAEVLGPIAEHACNLLPGLREREVVSAWTGLRPTSPDALPFIDWLDERVLVCAGHGSQGILTGGGSARLAADLLLGRLPFTDPTPFRLGRPSA